MPGAQRGVTVFTLGGIREGAGAALRDSFSAVEVLPIDLPPGASLAASQPALRAEVNRAANDWILLLREGERVTARGAAEMGASVTEPPKAWGFRLRIAPTCGGAPLLLDPGISGEIRFFHRRHARFDLRGRGEMNVEGTVLRLREPLERELFASHEAHRAWLAAHGVPHSALRRTLLFAKRALVTRALFRSGTTLRWLWDEAGWDLGSEASWASGASRAS
ncbi:MAG TPA: hypothetical protein VGE86_05615 [Thermoanaerobaculia bacterium]